jgi:hypothetical protein
MEGLKRCQSRWEHAVSLLNIYRNAHYNDSMGESYELANAINDILPFAVNAYRQAAPESNCEQLKVENAQLRAVITQHDPNFFKRKCRFCGCDWNHPCNDHDYWVEDDLCSACAEEL